MVIAFDIDDTITRHPEFFSFLSTALLAANHRVVIITFREDPFTAAADLLRWGVVYSELVTSSLDECLAHGVDEWKAAVCREHGVELFFEDDPNVLRHVDAQTVCLMPVDGVIRTLLSRSGESR
jgi:hypothetical protein